MQNRYGYIRVSSADQNERENIRKRQEEGIAAAKARGVRFGRPAVPPPEGFESMVEAWERKELSFGQLLERCGMSEATFYRRLRELRIREKSAEEK